VQDCAPGELLRPVGCMDRLAEQSGLKLSQECLGCTSCLVPKIGAQRRLLRGFRRGGGGAFRWTMRPSTNAPGGTRTRAARLKCPDSPSSVTASIARFRLTAHVAASRISSWPPKPSAQFWRRIGDDT